MSEWSGIEAEIDRLKECLRRIERIADQVPLGKRTKQEILEMVKAIRLEAIKGELFDSRVEPLEFTMSSERN